jgi:antitoxin component HigA of HigAB toxin-antitoxin module
MAVDTIKRWRPELRRAMMRVCPELFSWSVQERERYGVNLPDKSQTEVKPLGLTANALAKAIGVPPNRITAILKNERGITGDAALRLGTFFKTSARNSG